MKQLHQFGSQSRLGLFLQVVVFVLGIVDAIKAVLGVDVRVD